MCRQLKQLKIGQRLKKSFHRLWSVIQTIVPSSRNDWLVLCGLVLLVVSVTFLMGHSHSSVGVVDMKRLRELAEPYKEIAREREKYTQIWRIKFRGEQEVLDTEDKQLAEAQKKKSMKKKAFKKALDELQKKSLALQKKYQKEAEKIMMATQSAQSQIDELTMQLVADVAKQAGYDVVLSQDVLFVSQKSDITDMLVQELNKMAVKINYPDPETLTPNDE